MLAGVRSCWQSCWQLQAVLAGVRSCRQTLASVGKSVGTFAEMTMMFRA